MRSELDKNRAVILRGVGGHYLLHSHLDNFQGLAMLRGILRLEDIRPLPGDHVIYAPSNDPDIPWVIEEICERKNFLLRPEIANLDLLLITISASQPQPDLNMVDRLLVMSYSADIDTVIIINKIDEMEDEELIAGIEQDYAQAGSPIIRTGLGDGDQSLARLKEMSGQKTVSFAGQSGTGKSTILNRLFGIKLMETAELSEKIGRGRHTTRHTELFPLASGGYLADTPGFSQINLAEANIEVEELADGYAEIRKVKDYCRFASCAHTGDLGCAVTEDAIPAARYKRYLELRDEIISAREY